MHKAGMTIGAHTHRHPILSVEKNESAFMEIKKSKNILEEIIDSEVKYFAYPNGKFGRDFENKHKMMVKELGFEAALTTDIGLVNGDSDLMSLPRFTPWDKEPASFALRLCHHLYKLK
jgi:peptidoglycan/xylan/chitin deacetylase (PgdA/CDA1 family)